MKYIKSNPHPTGKKIGDCVVRALAYANNKKWIDVFTELCEIGKELYEMPNSNKTYETYLERHGWVKQKMPKHNNGRRMKLSEFVSQNPEMSFVANVVKHCAYIEKGTLLDTWDCGHKCVGNYYIKK